MMSDFEKSINASDLIDWIMCAFPDWCVGDVRAIVDHINEMSSAQADLITTIQIGIKATDADDVYSCGMRNGMRWCLSLIDGKEPLYENCPSAQAEQTRVFVELVVEYPDPELCTYKEYKGKPYYSIKYIENGETYVGYGTYNPKVLSQYLKEYFISSSHPDLSEYSDKLWRNAYERGKAEAMSDCMTFPNTVEEFMEQYKAVDTDQVYSNGTEFVPIFRMKQWFEHLQPDRMKLVQQAVNTIMSTSRSYSIRDRAFRNAARFVQCAIDGEAPDFEQIPEGDEMPSEPYQEDRMDKYGYIGIETLLNFCENSKDHSVTPNDFMRMKRVRMPELKKGRKINQYSYPAKWLCSECGAKHFDFSDKFCSECGVNVEEGE